MKRDKKGLFKGVARKFTTILADPPWRFKRSDMEASPEHKLGNSYSTLSLGEICKIPVARFVEDESCLYLWTPLQLLLDGSSLRVMVSWGFMPKQLITWVKVKKDGDVSCGGLGNYWRNATEFLLYGVRGGIQTTFPGCEWANVIMAQRRIHSQKPDEAYKFIEASSPGPYLELFARKTREGWKQLGNETGKLD